MPPLERARRRAAALGAAVLVLVAVAPRTAPAGCGEHMLCPGDRIDRDALATKGDWTFEGEALSSLVHPHIARAVNEHGVVLTLAAATPHPVDPRLTAATRAHAENVTLDRETRLLNGWVAGVPFPAIDPADPDAALKIIWNTAQGQPQGDQIELPRYAFVLTDFDRGVERTQIWLMRQFFMNGRITGGPPTLGDGTIRYKQLLIAQEPQDIKGLGTFIIRYDTGKVDDRWAYVRDVRRIRRLPGASWMDAIGSTDVQGDDINLFAAHPTWYSDYRILERRKALVIANSDVAVIDGTDDPVARFRTVDLSTAPYWRPVNKWEIRDIYVVEATAPADHVYGSKILAIDAKNWSFYFGDYADKAGGLWKFAIQGLFARPLADGSGAYAIWPSNAVIVDVRRRHATHIAFFSDEIWGGPMDEDQVSLAVLEASGR